VHTPVSTESSPLSVAVPHLMHARSLVHAQHRQPRTNQQQHSNAKRTNATLLVIETEAEGAWISSTTSLCDSKLSDSPWHHLNSVAEYASVKMLAYDLTKYPANRRQEMSHVISCTRAFGSGATRQPQCHHHLFMILPVLFAPLFTFVESFLEVLDLAGHS
jgi:hypothetical protein